MSRRDELASTVVARLRERIIHWEYPPGFRLTEEALCREFGVSRSPVREALRILSANNFVERVPRRGYAVRQLDLTEIEELYDLRLALEAHVVERLAARGAADPALDELERAWRARLAAPGGESEELARADEAFHVALARAMGNRALLEQLETINERLLVFRTIDFAAEDRVVGTCHQHLAILACIREGEPGKARAAMEKNINDGCDIVEAAIGNALAKAYLGKGSRAVT